MYDRGLPTRGVHGLYESQAHPTDLLQVQVLGPAASSSARKQHGYDSELILSLGSARRRPAFNVVGSMVIGTKSVGVLITIQHMALRDNNNNHNNHNLTERCDSPQSALQLKEKHGTRKYPIYKPVVYIYINKQTKRTKSNI